MTRKIEAKHENNRNKLALVMECLLSCTFSEDEEAALIRMGKAACPDPNWMDYIYWPDRHGLDGSVNQAIEKAFSYPPIILGPPTQG
jgi:hypothetical protein